MTPPGHDGHPPPPAGRPLRIVQLCAVDFTVRQFIAPLALALEADGHHVRCACTPGPHWEELRAMGVSMAAMPIARSANPLRGLRSLWRLWRWLRSERPDVLHVHTPVASMIGRVAGRMAGVPLIIYTAHGFYFHDRMKPSRRRLHVAAERFFGRFQDALFCVSAEDARAAVALRLSPRRRTFFVANGVDSRRFDPALHPEAGRARREEFGIPPRAAVVTIMGRLVREKGYAEFFAAARLLAAGHGDVHFLVIGDTVVGEHDSAREEILAEAAAPELRGRVHFAGMRRDIPELLAASDIFCLPSWREGMPVSILEAMMMALPVVATRIRGCREEVMDGDTGFLVEPGAAEDLAGAIGWLLRHPDHARKMGEAGRHRALRRFEEQRVLTRQVRLYRALWKRRAAP